MPDYTVLTAIAVVGLVVVEVAWLRTGIFRSLQYWITMAIVFAFQVLVDGWLTKLSDPIVIYNPDTMLGVRVPWDIPIEDFGFGFAMVTLAIMLWRRAQHASGKGAQHASGKGAQHASGKGAQHASGKGAQHASDSGASASAASKNLSGGPHRPGRTDTP